jgi:hypothetical protein
VSVRVNRGVFSTPLHMLMLDLNKHCNERPMLPSDSRALGVPRDDGTGQDVDGSESSKSATEQLLDEEEKLTDSSDDTQQSIVLHKRNRSESKKARSKRPKLDQPLQQKAAAVAEPDTSQFDLCTPEGQIAASKAANGGGNATITWMEAKRAARREYNRLNAARARQRHKSLAEIRDQEIMELKSQVEQLTRVNQFLLSQLSSNLVSAQNGASQSPVDPGAATSSWLWAMSTIAEAATALGNSSTQAPVGAYPQPNQQPLFDTALLSRLSQQQQQQQQQIQTNFLPLQPAAQSNELRQPPQQERSDTAMALHTLPEAATNNASLLMNMIASLPQSQGTSGNGILDLLLTLSKSQSTAMSAEDINELRRLK